MSGKMEALRYILAKASINVDGLKYYMDGTKYVMNEHDTAKNLLEIARDIVEELIIP